MQSPHASPVSPLFALPELPLHGKVPSPETQTLALDALNSSFGFPEPPARTSQRVTSASRRTSSGTPPLPSGIAARRKQHSSNKLHFTAPHSRETLDGVAQMSPRKSPRSPHSPPPMPPLGAASSEKHTNAAFFDASGVQDRTVEAEGLDDPGAERQARTLSQGEEAKGRMGSIDSQASSTSGSRGQGTSRTSASGIAVRTTGLSDRHDSLDPSPALSTSSSSTGELDETLDHEIDGEGTDGSASALSFSSDGDYAATPVTPATPALPDMHAPSSSNSSQHQQQSQWRPRELHLPQRTGPGSERERAIAGLTVRSPVVSRSTSPAFAHNVAAATARLSPVHQIAPLKIHTRAAPSTSSASGSTGSGTTLPTSGSSGPRGLLLASAAAPPGSARIKPSLITSSLSGSSLASTSSTPTREPFGYAVPSTPRSPLPVLSSTPAFPSTPSATVESMAAGRVPNDQLFSPPTRPSSNSLSPLSITQGIPSPLASGSVSPIASAPSWEMPPRDPSPVRDSIIPTVYSPPETPLEPSAFVAHVEAMEQERIKEHSASGSLSGGATLEHEPASSMVTGRARSGSGSFASSAASTRRTNSRRKPPPAPLLLVRIPASPDAAQFSPSAHSALPSALHVFHTPQSSPLPRVADLLEAEPEEQKSNDALLGSTLRPASRAASPPPTPFFDFENNEEEEKQQDAQDELELKLFRKAEAAQPDVKEVAQSSDETLRTEAEPHQGSVETPEPMQKSAEPVRGMDSVDSSLEKSVEAPLDASVETAPVEDQRNASEELLSASEKTSRMTSVSSVASSGATGDDAFEFDDGSDDEDAAESLMLSGAASELLQSIEPRPASVMSNESEGGNATDPGAHSSTDSSYSQPSVVLGMTPSSSGVSFRTSIFQDMQQSPRVDRFGPRGTPDITRGRIHSQYSSSSSRPPSQSAPMGPPPSGPLPTLPPSTPSSPGRPRAKTASQGSSAPLARVTSFPGLAKSAPALPTQPVPLVQRRDSSPPPSRPRRPSESIDLAPPKFAAHTQRIPPTPSTAPLPQGEWQPTALSTATRASISGPSSPEKPAAPVSHAALADRLRPELTLHTDCPDARPRPPMPIAKRSIVPDVPSFGYMGANQGPDSGPVSPIGSGAPPTPSGFSVFSEESSSEHDFVGMSSRWSSGSESDGESKAAAKAKATKGKKNAPMQRKSMRSSVSAQSGSMPPPAAPSTKKPNFLSGFGLRKKSFSNAASASGPSSASMSQRSNSPLTPGMTASSPAPTAEGSYEFPFPSNVTSTSSSSTSGMPSSWGPNRASQLGNGHERSRSRTGSMVARLSGAGPLLKTKQSNNSLRASSTEAKRRPSLSADHLASNGWPTPANNSYDSASLFFDSQRRPSLGGTSVTGLGIMDVEDSISAVSPTTATAMASAARVSQGSRLSSNMRSGRASFTNLRASREMSPLASPAAESSVSDSSALRKRSMPTLGSEARASRQTQLPSIAASRRPSVTEEKSVRASGALADEMEETPRVAYASLPGSDRSSVGSPPVMNTSRYFHSDAEGLTALGTAFTTWRDDESLPPSLPTSPTVPIPMRVGSLRKAHQRSHSKSSSLTGASLVSGTSSGSLASSTDSNATYSGRVLSPPPAPSPRSTSLKRPRRVLEREEVTPRPRYTSLTDLGRAWQEAHPNAPLEGAVGPKLLVAALAPRTLGAGQQAGDASGVTTPSDTTDYYGSSDGGGGGGRDASEGDEQGSSSGSGTGSGGDGKEPNDGNRPVRADVALESSSEESDEYGSDVEATLDANKALNGSGLSSRSKSSDDVPLGERVQNAAALQKRLRDQERKAQIETARSALERGGRTSKSDRVNARKLRGQMREAPPDASPLDALDLIARLQKVQLMQQQHLEQGGVPIVAHIKPASSAPQLRAQPGRARANTLRSADPRSPGISAGSPAVSAPPMPSLSPQHRVSPTSKTAPLPPQQPGQRRTPPGLTQAKLQQQQQQAQQMQQAQQQLQMQNAAIANVALRSASGPMRHRPSVGPDGQTEHKPPVATMMIPSTGSSPTPSSPAFSTTSLPHSSKMAAVVGQATFPMPPALPVLSMQGLPQQYSSTTPSSDGHAITRGGAAGGMDTAATVAVATARLRSRSVSRAKPPQGIDARIAPPLPHSSLARPSQPPHHSSPSPTSGPLSPTSSSAVPLPLVTQVNEPPRASTESGRPSQGAPSPSSTVASLAPNTQLVQHRVYIATRQRFGTALIAQGGRARDLVLDIMSKEYVPTDATGGGWVVFDCSPDWGIERPLREYEMISDVVDARPTPDDYFLLKRTELAPYLSFRAVPTSSPLLAGYVYVQDAKRKWNKRWLELREHSLFHAKSDKGKDEVFICNLSAFDAYLVDSNKIKAPKPHAFAVRSQNKITMFEKQADYIHYFCLGDPAAHRDWVRAILNACTYILKQERAVLFVPPVRPLNASSSDGPSSGAAEPVSRNVDTSMVARSGTTVSHHTTRNVEQRPMRSATMDARVAGPADAGVFTGPFEKGSLLASAAAKQAVQQGDLELSLHERTARARQSEAARRADLADRMRQARAGGQPLIDVAAREGM